MNNGTLRGTRMGATSYENDSHTEFAPRRWTTYDCPQGHETTMPFAAEADIPLLWECHCGAEALLRDGDRPEPKAVKPARTHWDMLIERRSIGELEELLEERLTLLREVRGEARSQARNDARREAREEAHTRKSA